MYWTNIWLLLHLRWLNSRRIAAVQWKLFVEKLRSFVPFVLSLPGLFFPFSGKIILRNWRLGTIAELSDEKKISSSKLVENDTARRRRIAPHLFRLLYDLQCSMHDFVNFYIRKANVWFIAEFNPLDFRNDPINDHISRNLSYSNF